MVKPLCWKMNSIKAVTDNSSNKTGYSNSSGLAISNWSKTFILNLEIIHEKLCNCCFQRSGSGNRILNSGS